MNKKIKYINSFYDVDISDTRILTLYAPLHLLSLSYGPDSGNAND